MLPAQRNKVDISKLTPDEQKAFRLYGKLPARPVANKASTERKYFDSGDWALSRSGKAEHANVPLGKSMPRPEEIPHASPTPIGAGGSSGSVSSSSPPTGTPLSPTSGLGGIASPSSPGSGPIPLGGANGSSSLADSGINLSMSPGRVGVGQPLATSPTRSFGSFGGVNERMSPTNSTSQNPLVARLESEAGARSSVLPVSASPHSGTTGNHIGKTQIRRASQSEVSPTAGANSGSHLSHQITAEDDQVAEMELQ